MTISNLPKTEFKWRTKNGKFITPSEMTTSHLFFTLRMIWNHTMPEDAKLRPYTHYSFGVRYPREYMIDAIRALTIELAARNDIDKFACLKELNMMAAYFKKQERIEAA